MENGHQFPGVLDYTVDQVKVFMRAITRLERIRRMSELFTYRASQYDKEGFQKVVRAMRKELGLPPS